MGLKKGSPEARAAGRKAARTRFENRKSGNVQVGAKPKGFYTERYVFKAQKNATHQLQIDVPCTIYISKDSDVLYITPTVTKVKS